MTARGEVVLQAGEQRLARIESLRALAAVGVMVGHAWGYLHAFGPGAVSSYPARVVYGGGYGVYLFFALTGYLLFWPFAKRAFADGSRVDLGRYALNRAVRILPLYLISMALLLIVQEGGGTAFQWLRYMTLTGTFSHATVGAVNGIVWSVIVEIHFYILLPVLVWTMVRVAGRSMARAALFLALLGAVSLVLNLVEVTLPDQADDLWRYSLPTTFFYFVPGMALALLRIALERRPDPPVPGWAGSSGVWLGAAAALWLVVVSSFKLAPLSAVAAFLTVGSCTLPLRETRVRTWLDLTPLATLGVASYSLYIWHMRVQERVIGPHVRSDALEFLLMVTLPLPVALVSYRVIEAPFLRLRRRWSSATAPQPDQAELRPLSEGPLDLEAAAPGRRP